MLKLKTFSFCRTCFGGRYHYLIKIKKCFNVVLKEHLFEIFSFQLTMKMPKNLTIFGTFANDHYEICLQQSNQFEKSTLKRSFRRGSSRVLLFKTVFVKINEQNCQKAFAQKVSVCCGTSLR